MGGQLAVRVVGTDLPGRVWGGHTNVHVGLQRKRDPADLVAGDASVATFSFTVERRADDWRGDVVQGKKGDRFFYLTWGDVDAAGSFVMFRRLKVRFDEIPADLRESGAVEGRLVLVDDDGGPRCASVRPPAITWR